MMATLIQVRAFLESFAIESSWRERFSGQDFMEAMRTEKKSSDGGGLVVDMVCGLRTR